jgi:hypothetical protein
VLIRFSCRCCCCSCSVSQWPHHCVDFFVAVHRIGCRAAHVRFANCCSPHGTHRQRGCIEMQADWRLFFWRCGTDAFMCELCPVFSVFLQLGQDFVVTRFPFACVLSFPILLRLLRWRRAPFQHTTRLYKRQVHSFDIFNHCNDSPCTRTPRRNTTKRRKNKRAACPACAAHAANDAEMLNSQRCRIARIGCWKKTKSGAAQARAEREGPPPSRSRIVRLVERRRWMLRFVMRAHDRHVVDVDLADLAWRTEETNIIQRAAT